MHKDGQHAELLFDLGLTRLGAHLQDVVGVHKGMVEQPVELLLLRELGVLLRQLLHVEELGRLSAGAFHLALV